jgi:hypothetical protein
MPIINSDDRVCITETIEKDVSGSVKGCLLTLNVRAESVEKAEEILLDLRRRLDAPLPSAKGNKSPVCGKCGAVMVRRKGKRGEFFGCSAYPRCNGTKQIEETAELETIPF